MPGLFSFAGLRAPWRGTSSAGGIAAVGLTLLCCYLLKKGVSPITIIIALFAVGILGRVLGFM